MCLVQHSKSWCHFKNSQGSSYPQKITIGGLQQLVWKGSKGAPPKPEMACSQSSNISITSINTDPYQHQNQRTIKNPTQQQEHHQHQ